MSASLPERVSLQRKLIDLTNNKGYQIIQINGQRIYGPLYDRGITPEPGSEVFIGRLPRNIFEDELVPIFENFGRIYQIRLMMDFRGNNRGYGFVCYYIAADAKQAIQYLNGFEIRPHRHIGVFKSVNNCRLFAGGIPLAKTKTEVRDGLSEFVDGITEVIMYSSYENKRENRGFAFIEFENHRMAALARRKLAPGSLVLWGVPILVDWAEPLPDLDPQVMEQVTILYIRNLDVHSTTQDLWKFLGRFLDLGTIIRTRKIKDFAFVHFADRKLAEMALEILQGKKFGNDEIEVMWSRPTMYSKTRRISTPPEHFCTSLPAMMRRQVREQANFLIEKKSNRLSNHFSMSQIFCENYLQLGTSSSSGFSLTNCGSHGK